MVRVASLLIFHSFYLCRNYDDPSPAFHVVSDNVSSLILGIQCSLGQGINNVEFRFDVFSGPLHYMTNF